MLFPSVNINVMAGSVFFAICFCVASCLSSTVLPVTPDCSRKFKPACGPGV